MRRFRLAWSFLTRLPGGAHPRADESLAGAVVWFPVVGLVVGAIVGGVHLGLREVVSAPLAAVLTVAVAALVTGAFHEDGLADTADALGGYTEDRRLEIMRDSRIGTFGTLALVVATGLKVVALASLDALDGAVALIVSHSLGRAGALVVMWAGPEARRDGLAATARDFPRRGAAAVLAVATVVAVAAGPVTAVSAGALAIVGVSTVVFARRRFGGVTGDVLGATEQVGEIVALVLVTQLVAGHGWLWA